MKTPRPDTDRSWRAITSTSLLLLAAGLAGLRAGVPSPPTESDSDARDRALRELLEGLAQVSRGSREGLDARAGELTAEVVRHESRLAAVRGALQEAAIELEALEERIASWRDEEERLASRLEALRVARDLLSADLPAAETIDEYLAERASETAGPAGAGFHPDARRRSEELFEARVGPLLRERCVRCHGTEKRKSGLSLASRRAAIAGGESGEALVPGSAAASLLYLAAAHEIEPFMPPGKPRASDEELAALREWIESGAFWSAGEREGER